MPTFSASTAHSPPWTHSRVVWLPVTLLSILLYRVVPLLQTNFHFFLHRGILKTHSSRRQQLLSFTLSPAHTGWLRATAGEDAVWKVLGRCETGPPFQTRSDFLRVHVNGPSDSSDYSLLVGHLGFYSLDEQVSLRVFSSHKETLACTFDNIIFWV